MTTDQPAPAAQEDVPRDVRLLHLIFATQGIASYQDHVPLQLMDFAHRYTSGILKDAIIYNDHSQLNNTNSQQAPSGVLSNAGNAGSSQTNLTTDDIRLAILSRTYYQFKPLPPKELLLELAKERNRKPLPAVIPSWGLRLPPEKYCLTASDWNIQDEVLSDDDLAMS